MFGEEVSGRQFLATCNGRLDALLSKCENMTPQQMVAYFVEIEFPKRICVASSFGAESAALLAVVADVEPSLPILFLDTGFLFAETMAYVRDLSRALGLTNVQRLQPSKETLIGLDPENSLWSEDPNQCCRVRKVEPFEQALQGFDCWISGLKRAHGGARSSVRLVEYEGGRFKLNPIANWSSEEVRSFIASRSLPAHPLVGRGYTSIGCIPCTRMNRPGEDVRGGRWARSDKSECGIHIRLSKMNNEASQVSDNELNIEMLNRSWMISGVCGTMGQKLLQRVLELKPRRVVGFDNNESELFFLYDRYRKNVDVKFYTGDIRDQKEVEARMRGCEFVLHTAATKHVYLCEESPSAAVNTNILGTQNIIEAALGCGVERVLFTSSDKAVNPTNVMGASKLMAERLVSAANAQTRRARQIFASTRFGNVLGSRGSVIPIFLRQIRAGGPVTITRPEMTRFIMTMREAVKLVMDSLALARGGEIFVTKMPVARIIDLAEVLIEENAAKYGYRASDISIEVIGSRPGEKMFEELMNEEEISRALELTDYFVIRPSILSNFRDIDYEYPSMRPADLASGGYNSKIVSAMSKEELRAYLRRNPELFNEK